MGTKKKIIALSAMLIFLSQFCLSNEILLYVQNNRLREVERILREDSSIVNKPIVVEGEREEFDLSSLLCIAAKTGLDKMVELLLRYEADPNLSFGSDRISPLFAAAFYAPLLEKVSEGCYSDYEGARGILRSANYERVAEILLENGADPNLTNRSGRTPFYWASLFSLPHIIRKLLEYGASIDEDRQPEFFVFGIDEDFAESQGLLKSAMEKHKNVQDLLREQDVDVNAIERAFLDEETPVCAKIKALAFLLDYRTALEVKDYFRQIPFTYCFFANEKLFGFACDNEKLHFLDCRGKSLEKSMIACGIPVQRPKRGIFSPLKSFFRKLTRPRSRSARAESHESQGLFEEGGRVARYGAINDDEELEESFVRRTVRRKKRFRRAYESF